MKVGLTMMGLASVGYLLATIGSQRDLFVEAKQDLTRWRRWLWISLALNTVGLGMYSLWLGHLPFTRMDQAIASLGWAVMLLYLLLGERWKVDVLGTVAAPAAFAMTAFSSFALWGSHAGPPATTAWLQVHVISLFLGYATFLLAAFCALLYFLQVRLLKKKKVSGLFAALPPLDTLDRAAYRFIRVGFPLLLLGIASGLLISNWHWNWDAKETMVALTALVYAFYLHARLVAGWQGRRVNMILLIAFVCVLFSYFIPGKAHPF